MFKKKKLRSNQRDLERKGVTETGDAKPSDKTTYQKFGAKASVYKGIKFDSELELRFYKEMVSFKTAGKIKDIQAHPNGIELLPTAYIDDIFKETKNRNGKKCLWNSVVYNADFVITLNNGEEILVDTKSIATVTDACVLKFKMLFAVTGKCVCLVYREFLHNLDHLILDLDTGRPVNPMTRKQIDNYLTRWRGIKIDV
jgi:hypothetical protein